MGSGTERSAPDFESLFELHCGPLYRFAMSLTRAENDVGNPVSATKGHQLQEARKVKPWWFTTLHRLFLDTQRRTVRHPHLEISEAAEELPAVAPDLVSRLNAQQLVELLGQVDPQYQAPVALSYMEDASYNEIVETLDIRLGMVRSRIAHGLARLKQIPFHHPARPCTADPQLR